MLFLLALSLWVGVSGAVYGLDGSEACRLAELEFLCWYVPEFSVLWRPFVVGDLPEGGGLLLAAYALLVFAYLAGPIVGALGGGLRKSASAFRARYLGPGWRF